MVQAVKCREDLELEGDVAFHFWLLPDVDAGGADEAFVAFGEVLPETGEEVAVLAGRVVNLNDPDVGGVREQPLVVVGGEGERGGLDLVHETAVLVVVLSFLGVAQHLPSLHHSVEAFLAGVAVGVLVGVVLGDQAFVLVAQLCVRSAA